MRIFAIGAGMLLARGELAAGGPLNGSISPGGVSGGPVVIDPPPPGTDERNIPLNWWNVVLLVNANSPASIEVAKMYREFYPGITDEQVLYLSGLPDSASPASTPADEIITRAQFETSIAGPLRTFLVNMGIVDSTYIIITTAGMPYRIEDTKANVGIDANQQYAEVIGPASTDGTTASASRNAVDAASVESELAALWQVDPALPVMVDSSGFPGLDIKSRVVNPYQGYISSMKRWYSGRNMLSRRMSFVWQTEWRISKGPFFEGGHNGTGYVPKHRHMAPQDIYLVSRLDGPRRQGQYPVFAVRRMLERSAAVSNARSRRFVGYNAAKSVVAIDNTPTPPMPSNLPFTPVYNFSPVAEQLDQPTYPIPPDGGTNGVPNGWSQGDHYARLYLWLTGLTAPTSSTAQSPITFGLRGTALYDKTTGIITSTSLPLGTGTIAYLSEGTNSRDGRLASYIVSGGTGGGPLLKCCPGAICYTMESYNALTFFTDANTPTSTVQGKMVDFITIGGTAAIGHAFEPEVNASVQGDFVVENLLRDDDGNGVGDLCWAEAAFTGIPYLSWAEVVIGDPLLRLRTGPGGIVSLAPVPGDVDQDGFVGFNDMTVLLGSYGSAIGQASYYVPADQDENGVVDGADLSVVMNHYGATYDAPW